MLLRRVLLPAVALVVLASGCSGASTDDGPAATPSSAPTSSPTSSAPVERAPFSWQTVRPRVAGFAPAALTALAADARSTGSSCFLVARQGKIVGEWYWQGSDASTAPEVYSVTKSVTSTLVGIAADDDLLDVDASAARHVPAWRGTPAARVTIRELLANDSGRAWSTQSDYTGLIRARDRTSYAVGLGQQHAPGTVWAYNNAAIQTLDAVLGDATGTDTATYARQALFGPLGMDDTFLTGDASHRSTSTAFGMHSTCRDLARFGTMFAQGGRWDGEQVVSRSWVRQAVGAPSQDLNAAYGLLWWLNREGPLRGPLDQTDPTGTPDVVRVGRVAPGAPADLYAAQGFGGQVVLVDPSTDTVVVRLGPATIGSTRPAYTFAQAARVVTEALLR